MLPATSQTALKEWAVTVRALDKGEQIILLRKGGIREEGKHFKVIYPEFLLYPTFEHQHQDLLKAAYHADLNWTEANVPSAESIAFSQWATVEEVIELTDQEKVDALFDQHIWTNDYAEKRLHWKPRFPLSVMLLRVYRMGEPRTVPYLDRYGGCKSWVDLEVAVPLGDLTPVLTDEEFRSNADRVKRALDLVSGGV